MNDNRVPAFGQPGPGLAASIRDVLQTCQAMALRDLAARVAAGEEAVRSALGFLMEQGDIERLRPVYHEGEELDHYRLRRESDGRYLRLRDLQRLMSLAS